MRKLTRRRVAKTEFGPAHRAYLAQRGEVVTTFTHTGPSARLQGELSSRQLGELKAAWGLFGPGIMREYAETPMPEIRSRWLTSGNPRIRGIAQRVVARVAKQLDGPPLGFTLFGTPVRETRR